MQKWPTTCFVFLSFNYIFKAAIWVFHKKYSTPTVCLIVFKIKILNIKKSFDVAENYL